MIDTYMRSLYQRIIVDPFAQLFAKWLSPNQITKLGCLIGLLAAPAIILNLPWLASFLLLMSGYLDTMDGTVARFSNKLSSNGVVLDILADRLVEFTTILGLYAVDPIHRGLLSLLMLGSCYICISSFLVVGIFMTNQSKKGFHYSPGLIERSESFLFFLSMIWFPDYFTTLALTFSALVLLTSYIRVHQFFQQR